MAAVVAVVRARLAEDSGGAAGVSRGLPTLDTDAARVAVGQRVVAITRDWARHGGADEQARAVLDDAHAAQALSSMLAVNQLGRLRAVLSDAGVRCLAVKGPALAAQITGDITSRTSGDIDLLIDPSDVRRAMEALIDNGVSRADDFSPGPDSPLFPQAVDVIQEAMFHIDGREVDLHWRLDIARGCLPWAFADAWSRRSVVDLGGIPVETLGLEDAAVFSASHGAKDAWSLLGQVVDHARLLRLVDWGAVTEHARASRALRRWELAAAMATRLDGQPRPVSTWARRRSDAMWSWLVSGQAPRGRRGALPTWRSFAANVGSYDRVADAMSRSRVLIWPIRSMAARDLGDLGDRYPVLYPIATPVLMPKRLLAKFRTA